MVKTLVEPKKTVVSSIRSKLLAQGYTEEVEYDVINIEPVLIYSKSEGRSVLFVRHKWNLTALVPLRSAGEKDRIFAIQVNLDLQKYEYTDEEGKQWLKFDLPSNEKEALEIISKI